MYDVVEMQKFKTIQNRCNKKLCLFLCKPSSTSHMVSKVSTCQKIHDQIQSLSVLESVVHVDNKRMFESAEQLTFVHHRVYTFLADNFCLEHLFHGKESLAFFELNTPYFSEPTLTNDVQIIEMKSIDFFGLDNNYVLFLFFFYKF